MSDKVSIESINEQLWCDEETGVLYWKRSGKGRRKSLIAGSVDKHGYLQTRVNGWILFNHRIIWALTTGSWPKEIIDHINGNRLDNRPINLRDVSRQTNQENQRKCAVSNKTTGLLGSSLHKQTGKYVAHIQHQKQVIYIGLYKTPEEAHQAYLETKRKLHKGATI